MALVAARRSSVTGEVIAQLEAQVASGAWPLGTRIPPESELAGRLGVSRNSVREAVRALAHTGVLQVRAGDGTYVRASSGLGAVMDRYLDHCDARHVLDVRRGLEREAARLAAQRATPADLKALEQALARRRSAIQGGDTAAFVAADVEFHHGVYAAAHNPVMTELLVHFHDALHRNVEVIVEEHPGADTEMRSGHEQLAAAIRSGSPEQAARASDALFAQLAQALGSDPGDVDG